MNLFKETYIFIMSLIARTLFNVLQPMRLEEQECNSNFTTKVNQGPFLIVVTVDRWLQETKTKHSFFDMKNSYYVAEAFVISDNKVIFKRTFQYSEPTKGYLSLTKLPHTIVAQATIHKVIDEMNIAVKNTA